VLLLAERIAQGRGEFRLLVEELHVERGEVVAVLGPNGAGKSTLFRILALLDAPRSGTVLIDGRPAGPRSTATRRGIAAVFQRPHLFAGSVADNVAFGLRARGVRPADARARAREWLDAFGLAALADADVRHISGGEAQRTALARAFATRPDLLLLDEPAASLDPLASRQLVADLERLVRDERRGVLLVTHDPAEAFALADRIAVLEDGRIHQVGTPADLMAAPATSYAAAITGAELLLDGRIVGVEGELVHVRVDGGAVLVALRPSGSVRAGAAVHLAYRPEDVVLARQGALEGTSVTNRLQVRVVAARESTGGLVRVRLEGPPGLVAMLTRNGAAALGVRPGARLEAAMKATALHTFTGAEGGR
jgi:molybdate transport system ATP-binding protein